MQTESVVRSFVLARSSSIAAKLVNAYAKDQSLYSGQNEPTEASISI